MIRTKSALLIVRISNFISRGSNEILIFPFANNFRDGFADFFEAGKIPEIWKIAALPRLHGLNRTIVAFEENAFTVGFVLEGESAPVGGQSGELLNEIEFAQIFERGEARDLCLR